MRAVHIMKSLGWFLLLMASPGVSLAQSRPWKIGVSRSDITYLSQGRAMMGYGDFEQKTRGIESSLFSRAFLIESENSRVAFVVVDLCMVLSHIKAAVLRQLNQVSKKKWGWSDVLILATHTHSGPGGYAQHDIYNVTGQGFDQRNFEVIVRGIRDSILKAEQTAVDGRVLVSRGELRGASINRSVEPYLANADAQLYTDPVDPTHYVFRFESLDAKPIGLLDFFAVHTTSMSRINRLISSDNKGHAAQRVEEHFGGDFVAAFANSNEGDASPNIFKGSPLESQLTDLEKTSRVAELQVTHALELWKKARELTSFGVSRAHTWVKMPEYGCEPAMGESFAAGADDGPSNLPGFYEGMRQGEFRALPFLLGQSYDLYRSS